MDFNPEAFNLPAFNAALIEWLKLMAVFVGGGLILSLVLVWREEERGGQ